MDKLSELPTIESKSNTLELSEYISMIASEYLCRDVLFVYNLENESDINNDAIEEDFIILEFYDNSLKEGKEFFITNEELNRFINQKNQKIRFANSLEDVTIHKKNIEIFIKI